MNEKKKKVKFKDCVLSVKRSLNENGDFIKDTIYINDATQEVLKYFSVDGEKTATYWSGENYESTGEDLNEKRYLIKSVVYDAIRRKGFLLFSKNLIDNKEMTLSFRSLIECKEVERSLKDSLENLIRSFKEFGTIEKTTIQIKYND